MEHTNILTYQSRADFETDYPDGNIDSPNPGVAYIKGDSSVVYNKNITNYTLTLLYEDLSGETLSGSTTMTTARVLDGNTVKCHITAPYIEGYEPVVSKQTIEISGNTEYVITYVENEPEQ